MNLYAECYVCIIKQAITAMTLNSIENDKQRVVIRKIMGLMKVADENVPPSEITGSTNQIIRQITGIEDFYADIKKESIQKALVFYPKLKALVQAAANPLDMALRISAAGNAIDVIHGTSFDVEKIMQRVLDLPFLGDGITDFLAYIANADYLLLIADNAGETVFDRVLIETLPIPVQYAVKSGPILNDATKADAIASGIDPIAEIIETGSNGPGTTLHQCSDTFRRLFDEAPLILAKGQANFETLDEKPLDPLYLLFLSKCAVIARHLNLPTANIVLKHA
ncbi:MAG: DUF89 family protein [Anaerolineaceae bacterium]|nr:DUF89 family protein [Anaerolineaceae bacterium]